MAFTDWTITGTTTPLLHRTLSNALPSSPFGFYGRSMGVIGGAQACTMYLNDSNFVGIPNSKQIICRGRIRKGTNTGSYIGGVVCKRGVSANYGYAVVYNSNTQSYELSFNNGSTATIAHGLGGTPTDYWLSYELKVIPLGGSGDQIILSKETSLGSGTYSPILITGAASAAEGLFITSTDAKYAPWGGTTNNGFSTTTDLSGTTIIDGLYFQLQEATSPLTGGAKYRYDASDTGSMSLTGALVDSWTSTGTRTLLLPADLTTRPTAGGTGSDSYVEFDGVNDAMDIITAAGALDASLSFHFFAVVSVDDCAAQSSIQADNVFSMAQYAGLKIIKTSTSQRMRTGIVSNDGSTKTVECTSGIIPQTKVIIDGSLGGGVLTSSQNGTNPATIASGANVLTDGWTGGIGYSSFASGYYNGKIHEILYYPVKLTGTDYTDVITHLTNKWDVYIDPYYSSVVLLLMFEGADASTTMIDYSKSGHVCTAIGNAQIDTAEFKIGTSSLLLDGSVDYLTVPDSNDFAFSNGDFTIESWFRMPSNPTSGQYRTIISQRTSYLSNMSFALQIGNYGSGSMVLFTLSSTGSNDIRDVSDPVWSPTINEWHHVAVTRSGDIIRIFGDGVLIKQYTLTTPGVSIFNSTQVLSVGGAPGEEFIGHLDAVRITKSIARYTTTFTPPLRY